MDAPNATLSQLLTSVYHIREKYDHVARATGEYFNIFSVLGLETKEVQTHSRFLAELLNPQGSHGLGSLPLELFLEQYGKNGNTSDSFDTKDAKVFVEYYIGPKEGDRGGRIDIYIDLPDHLIVIENKIYAGDQEKQLLRYHNHGKERNQKNFYLYYLTLEGAEPSEESLKGLEKEQVKCISYAKDILTWLEACREKSVEYPLLRETLTQYINLIKLLTNQTLNDQMKTETIRTVWLCCMNQLYLEDKGFLKIFHKTGALF